MRTPEEPRATRKSDGCKSRAAAGFFSFSFFFFFSTDVRAPFPQTPDSSSVLHGISLSSHSLCHAVLPSHFLAHTQRQTASWLASQSSRQGAPCNPGDGVVQFSLPDPVTASSTRELCPHTLGHKGMSTCQCDINPTIQQDTPAPYTVALCVQTPHSWPH